MDETPAQRLGRFDADHGSRPLPDPLTGDVGNRLVDLIGVAPAAADDPTVSSVEATVAAWGGEPKATALSTGTRLPAPNTALINGTMAHALDVDDTHLPSIVHPSSSVIPAALAAAEESAAGGQELMAAVAVGLETCVRLGMASYDAASHNHVFFERGLHATGILGALAAAVSAGVLYGLSAVEIASAIGIASSMGAGLLEANRTSGTVERLHNGCAAHSGIAAAQLSRSGITGPPTVLEGRFGLFQAYSGDRWSAEPVIDGLGSRWEFLNVHYRPYPTNHFTHAGIDAALAASSAGISVADIRGIEVGVPEPTLRTIVEPVAAKLAPDTGYKAKFSGPFTIAAALSGSGGLGVGQIDMTDEMTTDPERLRLAGLVECVADKQASARFPNAFGGVLRIATTDGQVLEHRVEVSKSSPHNPLSVADLDSKFFDNAGRHGGDVIELLAAVRSIGDATDVRTLAAHLASVR